MDEKEPEEGWQRAAGRDGSDRCRVGFRKSWHRQEGPEMENKEGNALTLCLGTSCPVLPFSNQKATELALGD